MKKIEKRTYSKAEMAEIIGKTDDAHLARNIKSRLSNWGYGYTFTQKTVTITSVPTTIQEKINECMLRIFNVDTRIDTLAFARFFYCCINEDKFNKIPWRSKAKYYNEKYNTKYNVKTLQKWMRKLLKIGMIERIGKSDEIWHTNSDKERTVTPLIKKDKEYYEYYHELFDIIDNKDLEYGKAVKGLFMKYGCYYKTSIYNVIDEMLVNDDFQELLTLIAFWDNSDSMYALSTVFQLNKI